MLIYHSPLKYFLKGLLGRKNDAWYFDRMVKAYDKQQQQLTAALLTQAQAWAAVAPEVPMPADAIPHPLYNSAMQLRQQLLQSVQQAQPLKGKTVLFQMPPAGFSPGWASWFGSLAEGMRWMGATVHEVWDDWPAEWVQTADYFFSQANPVFTQRWPAELASWRKAGAVFACYCSFEQLNEGVAVTLYQQLAAAGINCLLNAADVGFIANSPHSRWAAIAGLPIRSLPFAANPLRHYPTPWYLPRADYVFLGSANYDKARRYHDYFYPLIQRHKGVLAGQGWPWSNGYELHPQRDRWMYAQARVAINLHLQSQITEPTELNERTYILFASGTPQLLDCPALFKRYFMPTQWMAETPHQYMALLQNALADEKELWHATEQKLQEVYKRHLIFHRIAEFAELPSLSF